MSAQSPEPMSPDTVIAAGGIALAAAEADASDRLDALAFTHPALPGRTVVRLVPERVASGARTEMALTGFLDAGATEGVGRVRRRALGFPARALVEHPEDARYALAVMKDFAAAKKRIATKPGHAKDAFVAVAETLGRGAPHFLPSFWEEAGRAFLAGSAVAMAATAFEKARAAEREHGLAVDEDARADAFLEFAIAGALPVKSILAWPAELKKSHGPEIAYTRLYDLAVRRTLGGRAPWASLPKDLKDLAKAAKRDPAAEEGRFVRAVLGAAALRRAPIGFWKPVAESVVQLAQDPVVAERLARLFPELSDEDASAWIALLIRWGVVDRIAGGLLGGGTAAWVGKALEVWDDVDGLDALVRALIPRLLAEGAPVPVFREDVWRVSSVDTFEALLAAGVPLAVGDDPGTFALARWAEGEREHVDPVHLAAHPVLGKVLTDSVRHALHDTDFQRVAPGMTAFREARRAHLVETVGSATRGGLLDLEVALDTLENEVPASTRAEFPDEAAPIATLGAAGALARTLGGGVLDELGWPALDSAVAELRGAKNAEVVLHSVAPWAIVTDNRRAVVVGPSGIEGRFDLKLPKNARLAALRYAAGQLLVAWHDPQDWSLRKGYWSGSPKEILELEIEHRHAEITPPHAGGVLCGDRLLRPGDTHVGSGDTFCDAEGAWATDDDGVLRALDPLTGKRGAPDAPAALAPRDGVPPDYGDSVYHPRVSADSPLGAADPYGFAVFSLSSIDDAESWLAKHAPRALRIPHGEDGESVGICTDGRAVVYGGDVQGLVTWPGADAPRLLAEAGWRDSQLVGPDGARLAKLEEGPFWAGSPVAVPLPLWHHLRPRDPAGSVALRTVDEAVARALLAAAEGLEDDEDGVAALAAQVKALLPVTHDALAKGVASVVLQARGLQQRIDAWREEDATAIEGTRDGTFREALLGLVERWGDDETSVVAAIRTASAFLTGADTKLQTSDLPWRDWLDTWGALAFRARAPLTTPDERAAIDEILAALAESRFAGAGVRRVKLSVPPTAPWLVWHVEYGDRSVPELWARADAAFRVVVFTEDQDDDAVTLDVLIAGANPPGATIEEERPVRIDADAIRAQLAAPALTAVGDDVYAAIAGPTGLGRAEAAVVWSGFRKLDRWGNDPLGKEGRERLGLKLAETKLARDALSGLDNGKVARAYHLAVSDAALGDPADAHGLPARLGDAWAAVFGQRVKLDDALLARARADLPGGDVDALTELAGAATADVYQRDARWKLAADGPEAEADHEHFDGDVLQRGVGVVYWLYANTPGDDPLRDAAAAAVTAMRARLDALVLTVARGGGKPLLGWFKRFDGAPFVPADIDADIEPADRPTGKDGGGIVAFGTSEDVVVAVRPTRLRPGDADELDRLVKLDDNWEDDGPWRALALLGRPELDAMLADRAPGWSQDPRQSAPDVVKAVADKHGLDADAATLYLQLLALPNPTKANVLAWNGWKPAVYAKAAAALVDAKLVIEAKRARAGRDHFLPGGWHERRTGSLPLEEWKLPLYGGDEPPLGSILPLTTFGALFEAAWARVVAGKGPKYERR